MVPLPLLQVKVPGETQKLYFWTLPTNKQGTVYVLSF